MLAKAETEKALQRFIKHVQIQAKSNLTNKDKNVTKGLQESIKGHFKVMPNSISLWFEMNEYGLYQDKGVKGKNSSQRAPKSPYKFGTGTGKKGGLTDGIFAWVNRRKFQFKDDKGKFMSYKATAWLITKSIYSKGLKPSLFFTKPFESAYKNLPDELRETYGLNVTDQFFTIIKQPNV